MLNSRSTAPLHLQIYENVRQRILEHDLKPGAKLPSSRALSAYFGVSRHTVVQAYDQLLAEGYTEAVTGSGTYVTKSASTAMEPTAHPVQQHALSQMSSRLSRYGQLLSNATDIPTSTSIIAYYRYDFRYALPTASEFAHKVWSRLELRRLREGNSDEHRYGAPEGYAPLREAIAKHVRSSRGISCSAEQVVVVNGSHQALDLIARLIIDPGDIVIMEEPSYRAARRVFSLAQANLQLQPVDDYGLNPACLPDPSSAAKLVYVTPSQQFPTGAVMPFNRRLALLEWASKANAYVLENDYGRELRYAGRAVEPLQILDREQRVIYMSSFSKIIFPGLRLAYLVLPPDLLTSFRAAKWLTDRQTGWLEQRVLTDFISNGDLDRHIRRSRTINSRQRATLIAALKEHYGDSVSVQGAPGGIHLVAWFSTHTMESIARLAAIAASHQLGIYPNSVCYASPPDVGGLLMGFTAMSDADIRSGIHLLKTLDDAMRAGASDIQ